MNQKKNFTYSLKAYFLLNTSFFVIVVYAEGLKKYFEVVSKLAYDEKPDYNQLRQFLRSGTNNEWVLGLTAESSLAKVRGFYFF